MTDDLNYAELDPGVRKLVRLLRAQGFRTCDSGDGVSKPPEWEGVLTVAHVFMETGPEDMVSEANLLFTVLESVLHVPITPGMIQASFDPADGSAVLAVMGVNDAMIKPEYAP